MIENIRTGDNPLIAPREQSEEGDDSDDITENQHGIDAEKFVKDHLTLLDLHYKIQIRNSKSTKFFLEFDLPLEEKILNFKNACKIRPQTSQLSPSSPFSELSKAPYPIAGARLMKGRYIADFKAMMKSMGIDDEFHCQAVELTKEYEKMLYRKWMTDLFSYFSEASSNAK